jgi:hypothetical protein
MKEINTKALDTSQKVIHVIIKCVTDVSNNLVEYELAKYNQQSVDLGN